MNIQKEISEYIRQVGKSCPYPFRRKLLLELQSNLSDFLYVHPDCTMEDVLSHFGTPEKFADEYILAMDTVDRQIILQKGRFLKKVVCVGMIIVLLIVISAAAWIVHENAQSVGNYYTDEIHVSD